MQMQLGVWRASTSAAAAASAGAAAAAKSICRQRVWNYVYEIDECRVYHVIVSQGVRKTSNITREILLLCVASPSQNSSRLLPPPQHIDRDATSPISSSLLRSSIEDGCDLDTSGQYFGICEIVVSTASRVNCSTIYTAESIRACCLPLHSVLRSLPSCLVLRIQPAILPRETKTVTDGLMILLLAKMSKQTMMSVWRNSFYEEKKSCPKRNLHRKMMFHVYLSVYLSKKYLSIYIGEPEL